MKKMLTYICNNRGEIYTSGGDEKREAQELALYRVKRPQKAGYKIHHLFGTWYFVKSQKKCYQKVPVNKILNLAKVTGEDI